MVGAYASSVGVILSFLFTSKRRSRLGDPSRASSAFAISISVLWNLYILVFFVALLTDALKIEEAPRYLEPVGSYMAFIPTVVITNYFRSQAEEPAAAPFDS